MGRPAIFLVLVAALLLTSDASRLQGDLPPSGNFGVYVGKFCFDYTRQGWVDGVAPEASGVGVVGRVRIGVSLPPQGPPMPKGGTLYFLIFDDEDSQWKRARRDWERSTCEEKKAVASKVLVLDVHAQSREAEVELIIREHLLPRFWYYTFVACGLENSMPIRYAINSTNEMDGWQQEFSVDHMGLLRVYEVLTFGFSIAGVLTAWATRCGEVAQEIGLREHPYIQLLNMAYIASTISCGLFLSHYYMFMQDGFGSLRIRFFAVFAGVIANCTIYLIAILASSGWAISNSSLPHRRLFLGMISIVGCLHAWTELQAELRTDQSTHLYAYQGGTGMFTMVLKLFVFCWFAFQVCSSYEKELNETKRRFFKYLGVGLGGWAINIPVTVIIAFATHPWMRYKVVTGADIFARFFGLCLLSWLFCGPSTPLSSANTFRLQDYADEPIIGFGK